MSHCAHNPRQKCTNWELHKLPKSCCSIFKKSTGRCADTTFKLMICIRCLQNMKRNLFEYEDLLD